MTNKINIGQAIGRTKSGSRNEKYSGRKRLRLSDAMRKVGLDEHKLAETYADVVEKLRKNTEPNGSLEKVLAGVLKECSRVLEPVGGSDVFRTSEARIPIHLVHKVPRPYRSIEQSQCDPNSASSGTKGIPGPSESFLTPLPNAMARKDSE